MAGPILLDTSFVYPDNKYDPVRDWGNGGGYNFIPGNYVGMPVFTSHQMSTVMGRLNTSISYTVAFTNAILKPVQDQYAADSQALAASIETQLAATRLEFGTNSLPPVEAVKREMSVRQTLVTRKAAAYQADVATANSFFGSDPLPKTQNEIALKAFNNFEKGKIQYADSLKAWERSYRAAYSAKLHADTVTALNTQYTSVLRFLDALQLTENQAAVKEATMWAEIRAWGEKLTARRNPIVNQYNADVAAVEPKVQSELDAENARIGPLPQQTAGEWVSRALAVVNVLSQRKYDSLKALNFALSQYPGVDFKNSDLKGFLERARDGKLPSDAAFEHELSLISTAYRADVITREINSLEGRLPALNTAQAYLEAESLKDGLSFLADTNEEILTKYGERMSKVARDLQSNISGKKIRSYNDAMATFETVRSNPRAKLSGQDSKAVADALKALDKATFAANLTRLGKAFGVVGKIVQGEAIRQKAVSGYETGDWKPLGLEIESMAVGTAAASAAGALLAVVLALFGIPAIVSIPAVAVLMALISAYIDAAKVDEINGYFFK